MHLIGLNTMMSHCRDKIPNQIPTGITTGRMTHFLMRFDSTQWMMKTCNLPMPQFIISIENYFYATKHQSSYYYFKSLHTYGLNPFCPCMLLY